jgi:HEAT repeat protein
MDTTTRKILKLLSDERMERRCAAAMVLGELRTKEPEVVKALGQCLAQDSRVLQLYALEALAGSKSSKVAGYVMPLLEHPDDEIRAQATALLANQGSRGQAALAKELQGAPLPRRRAIVNILARNHDRATFERLIQLLPDAEIGEFVLNALRNEIEHLGAKETEALLNLVMTLLKKKAWLADTVGTALHLTEETASRAARCLGRPATAPGRRPLDRRGSQGHACLCR